MHTDDARHVTLASPTRRSILKLLSSQGMRDALSLSRDLSLHVTTVRFHLEHLESAGLVRVEPAVEKQRGRPRLIYAATGQESSDARAQTQLVSALAGALGNDASDRGRARSIEAGRRWADQIVPVNLDEGDNPDALVTVLTGLGFDPVTDESGMDLLSCPFREAARNDPQVVCSVHEGLVKRIAERTNPLGARAPELLPFVTPTECRIDYH